jgi:hypothetical protein
MARINTNPTQKPAFAVAPSPTTVDQFDCDLIHEKAKLWVENLDGAQTLTVTIQTRPVKPLSGAGGNWAQWQVLTDPIPAGTVLGPIDLDMTQSGEMRVQLAASGAGLSCNYTRVLVGEKWP